MSDKRDYFSKEIGIKSIAVLMRIIQEGVGRGAGVGGEGLGGVGATRKLIALGYISKVSVGKCTMYVPTEGGRKFAANYQAMIKAALEE